MPLVGTRGGASARAYGFTSGAPEVLGGMVLVAPTSITSTGTGNSSSINSNGSVTFDTCATLSLNGVFTADYDNYMLVMRHVGSDTSRGYRARLRLSGIDATATDYAKQYIFAENISVTAARSTLQNHLEVGGTSSTNSGGDVIYLYGPALAQPTASRNVNVYGKDGAVLYDNASTHSLSTAYDGITLFPSAGNFTGLVSVYGLVGA